MADRKQIIKVIVSLVALAFSTLIIVTMLVPDGCGPSEDERILRETLNNLPEITEKNGKVKELTVDRGKEGDDDVYRYNAEIVDAGGVAIGHVRGGRIEGFGTMKPRVKWYKTPGVKEEWEQRNRDRGERRGQRQAKPAEK